MVLGLGPSSPNRLGGARPLAAGDEALVLVGPVENHKALWRKDRTSVLFHVARYQIAGSSLFFFFKILFIYERERE